MSLGAPSIGKDLKEARAELGLTLARASEQTRIKVAYLEAIESMKTDALPSIGYVLGYIRTYASFLGQDGEIAVRRYKVEVAGPKHIGWRERAIFIPKRKIKLPRGLVSALGVVMCAIIVTAWYGTRLEALTTDQAQDGVVLTASNSTDLELDVLSEAPDSPPNILTVKATGPSWVQIKDPSGKVLMSRIMVSGETWKADRDRGVTLSARDGGVLELYKGVTHIGALGPRGHSINSLDLREASEPSIGIALIDTFETPK